MIRFYALIWILTAASVAAQSDDNVRVWAAVAFINHGEKTPSLSELQQVLTPQGAQQMWRQGSAFRTRYLNASDELSSSSKRDAVGTASIYEMDSRIIDNVKLDVISAEDEWVVGSALAFTQALYPPYTDYYGTLAGGDDLARNLANGTSLMDYPLNGYQYPQVKTFGSVDSESPSVQGTIGCNKRETQIKESLKERDDIKKLVEDNSEFYKDLFSSTALERMIKSKNTTYWDAYELYEYVKYMYSHNETVFDGLEDADETLSKLEENALAVQMVKNTKLDEEYKVKKDKKLYDISGKTMAKRVTDQFKSYFDSDTERNKLSLMFGSFEPILAFLSIIEVFTKENTESGPFAGFPRHGATMVFELIGDVPEDTDAKPKPKDVNIRFLYRPSADEAESFEGFDIFGNGTNIVPYEDFIREMDNVGMTSEKWCKKCKSDAPWCKSTKDKEMHPVVIGFLGALAMLAIVGFVFLGRDSLLCALVDGTPSNSD